MERQGSKSKKTSKLNRDQVIDILERNVSLYKDDPSFVHYLAELAIYLMEYEYDWSEVGPHPSNQKTPSLGETSPTPPESHNAQGAEKGKIVFSQLNPNRVFLNRKSCPYCGSDVGEALICPVCRNLTR
jgi:hypothetical protein